MNTSGLAICAQSSNPNCRSLPASRLAIRLPWLTTIGLAMARCIDCRRRAQTTGPGLNHAFTARQGKGLIGKGLTGKRMPQLVLPIIQRDRGKMPLAQVLLDDYSKLHVGGKRPRRIDRPQIRAGVIRVAPQIHQDRDKGLRSQKNCRRRIIPVALP